LTLGIDAAFATLYNLGGQEGSKRLSKVQRSLLPALDKAP